MGVHIYSSAYEGRFAATALSGNLTAYVSCEEKATSCVATFPVIKAEHQLKPNPVLGLEIKPQNFHLCLRVLKKFSFVLDWYLRVLLGWDA